jgi:hypothetical protein
MRLPRCRQDFLGRTGCAQQILFKTIEYADYAILSSPILLKIALPEAARTLRTLPT